jgi:transposase
VLPGRTSDQWHSVAYPHRVAVARCAPCYGDFRTLHGRHRRWSADGTWEEILAELQADSDTGVEAEWAVAIDSTVVRAHQHAAGARHQPPKDVPEERLAPSLPTPAAASSAAPESPGHTGG